MINEASVNVEGVKELRGLGGPSSNSTTTPPKNPFQYSLENSSKMRAAGVHFRALMYRCIFVGWYISFLWVFSFSFLDSVRGTMVYRS